jgi:hypothetical protein
VGFFVVEKIVLFFFFIKIDALALTPQGEKRRDAASLLSQVSLAGFLS